MNARTSTSASRAKRHKRRAMRAVFLLIWMSLAAVPALAIDWISSPGGNWEDGFNWMGGVAPGPGDDAVITIPVGGNIVINSPITVRSLTLGTPGSTTEQTIFMNSSTSLTLEQGGIIDGTGFIQTLDGTAVTVQAGTLNIVGFFNYRGGDLVGPGEFIFTMDNNDSWQSTVPLVLNNTALRVQRQITLLEASTFDVHFLNGATLDIQSGGTWSVEGTQNHLVQDATANQILLAGTMNVGPTATGPTNVLQIDVPINNDGTIVTRNSASLQILGPGNHTGDFSSGGDFEPITLGGGIHTCDNCQVDSGKMIVTNATLDVRTNGLLVSDISTFELETGGLLTATAGPATASFEGDFEWNDGDLGGDLTTDLDATSTMRIKDGPVRAVRDNHQIINGGSVLYFSTGEIQLQDSATVTNNSTWSLEAAGTFRSLSPTAQFNNMGTLSESSDVLAFTLGIVLNHQAGATFTIDGGIFSIEGDTTLDANVTFVNNPTVRLVAGTVNANNMSFTGPGGTLDVDGANLMVAAPGSDIAAGIQFQLLNGEIGGPGTWTVPGDFNWIGGNMAGPGITDVTNGGPLGITSANPKELNAGRILRLSDAAASVESGAPLGVEEGSVIEVPAGQTLTILEGATILADPIRPGGKGRIDNQGTVEVVPGGPRRGGATEIHCGVDNAAPSSFNNSVSDLALFGPGTWQGNFNTNTVNTRLESDTKQLNGATFDGTGSINLVSGQLDLAAGGATVNSGILLDGGVITGSGTMTVSNTGNLGWHSGGFNGTGRLVNNRVGQDLIIGTATGKDLLGGFTLESSGPVAWNDGSINFAGDSVFRILLGAQLNVNGPLATLGSGQVAIDAGANLNVNAAGTAFFDTVFSNLGNANVVTGILSLRGGGSNNGIFDVGSTAELEFQNGNFTHGGNLQGTGTVRVAGTATVTSNGNFSPGGPTFVVGGTLAINGTNAFANLTIDGGDLTGTGAVDVVDLSWNAGNMTGNTTTTVTGTTNISTPNPKALEGGRDLRVANGGSDGQFAINTGSTFEVTAGNTFLLQDGAAINSDGSAGTQFLLNGTLQTGGAGVKIVAADTVHTGTIDPISGPLRFTGSFTQTAGTTNLGTGEIQLGPAPGDGTFDLQGGQLLGPGRVMGDLQNAGNVEPGTGFAVLNVDGNFTQTAAGQSVFQLSEMPIKGKGDTIEFDSIQITGTASFAGDLVVNTQPGLPFQPAQVFPLIQYASQTGTFNFSDIIVDNHRLSLIYQPSVLELKNLGPDNATWTGGGGDNFWNNPANWDVNAVPGPNTNVVIGGTSTLAVQLDSVAYANSVTLGGTSGTQELDLNSLALNLFGSFQIQANGLLRFPGAVADGNMGVAPNRGGPDVLNNGDILVSSGSGLIDVAFTNNNVVLVDANLAAASLGVATGFTNSGDILLTSQSSAQPASLAVVDESIITNQGFIRTTQTPTAAIVGILQNNAGATLDFQTNVVVGPSGGSSASHRGISTISNSGTMVLDGNGQSLFVTQGAVLNGPGALFRAEGTVVIQGTGFSLTNQGTIQILDNDTRLLAINGDFQNVLGAQVDLDLDRNDLPNSSRLSVTGTANLDGTLLIASVNAQNGDLFRVVDYGTRNGTFATIDTSVAPELEFQPDYTTNGLDLSVGTPEIQNPQFFVVSSGANELVAFRASDSTVQSRLPIVGATNQPAANLDGSRLYVPDGFNNVIHIVDTVTNTVVDTITEVFEPVSVFLTPDQRELWVITEPLVGERGLPGLQIVNLGDNSVSTPDFGCGTGPIRVLFDPIEAKAYVVDQSATVCVVDAFTKTLIDSASFDTAVAEAAIGPAGNLFLAVSGNQILKIDTEALTAESLPTNGVPSGLDVFDGNLYVAQNTDDILVMRIVDSSTSTISLGAGANATDLVIVPSEGIGYAIDFGTGLVHPFDPTGEATFETAFRLGDQPTQSPTEIITNDARTLGAALVRLDNAAQTVGEGDGLLQVPVNRTGVEWGIVTVDFDTTNNSATGGLDFDAVSETLIFDSGDETQNVPIAIIDDILVEGPETFNVELSNITGNGLLGLSDGIVAITDNDEDVAEPGVITLDAATYRLSEGDGQLVVNVLRGDDSETTASVRIRTVGASATAGADFQPLDMVLQFEPGQTGAVPIAIDIIDDGVDELTEGFDIVLSDPVGAVLGDFPSATVGITDNDFSTVSWTTAAQQVEEGSGGAVTRVTLQAALGAGAERVLRASYSVGGSATVGTDHNLESGSLIFPAGVRVAEVTVNIAADRIEEPDETIVATLLSGLVELGPIPTHTITILNDDTGDDGDDGGDGGDGTAPETVITSPESGIVVALGSTLSLQASATDPQGDPVTFRWEVCRSSGGCVNLSGPTIQAQFPSAGVYEISCTATDDDGNTDPTPARIRVIVRQAIPPEVEIVAPTEELVDIGVGDTVSFQARIESETPVTSTWFLISNPELGLGDGESFSYTFDEVGLFTVAVTATNDAGARASDFVNVRVSEPGLTPIGVVITEPDSGIRVTAGEAVQFAAEVINPDKRKKDLRFFWRFGNGGTAEGQTASAVFTEPGRYQVVFAARDVEEDILLQDSVVVYVVSNEPPVVDFNFPTDLQIEPFGSAKRASQAGVVFFQSKVVKSNGWRPEELNFFWDFGDGRTSLQDTPGQVIYREEGVFTATLYATTPNGLTSEMATRTITVRQVSDEMFEPNETFGQAPSIGAGNFDDMSLDDESSTDVFKITIDQDGQRLDIKLDMDGRALVQLFDASQNLLRQREIELSGNLQLVGLRAGDYFLCITAIEDEEEAKDGSSKAGLGYGFSVAVLSPGLYFADVRESESFTTELGIVNTTGSSQSLEATGYDAGGNIVKRVAFELEGNGRTHQTVAQMFEDESGEIAWVQVDATGDVVGYTRTDSRDEKESYLITGGTKLSSELFIPHIAERVDQWFTRAAVVNATDSNSSAEVRTASEAAQTVVELNVNQPFGKDAFDFLDRFGGDLPAGKIWAQLNENSASNFLTGSEVFGTIDGSRISAGLELVDTGGSNPNFTFVPNTLYFTHIASDVQQFWTGLALVNVGTTQQGVIITGYGEQGNLVGEFSLTLAPGEKIVDLAENMLAEIGSPANIGWLKVVADSDIVGFELFGTHNQKQLAGLEATTDLRDQICFPYYDASNTSFQGISVVNVNNTAVTLAFTLYNDLGEAIQTAQRTLNANQKTVELFSDLLPASGRDETQLPGWVECRSDLPLAGFQLIIGKNGEQMSALKAQ
ncbi:PKD domain-containing protein [Sulfidibacter corallicola]|uniref:PKD domain-containing protein n=1 Tax=Sulfidibacter corallicola TaxID=2818388 RepID=A0A8A4U1I9_SULCO|nr:Calx-beta domain-containing protein [Sulfidibacter corallicola]QTD52605.1 PKD domain-containing protein [Sulfidibacter corallicola]